MPAHTETKRVLGYKRKQALDKSLIKKPCNEDAITAEDT